MEELKSYILPVPLLVLLIVKIPSVNVHVTPSPHEPSAHALLPTMLNKRVNSNVKVVCFIMLLF